MLSLTIKWRINMKIYVVHLIKYKNKSKRIQFPAESMKDALQYVYSNYSSYQISMIWPEYP